MQLPHNIRMSAEKDGRERSFCMKKMVLSLFFIFIVAVASFGTDFNFGIGGGIHYQGIYGMEFKYKDSPTVATLTNHDIGIFIFLDATYAELDILFDYGFYTFDYNNQSPQDGSDSALEISLLGKYPFSFENFTLFPLLGISYQFWNFEEELGVLGILGGIGTDFSFSERLYIRGELLYGINLWNAPQEYANVPIGHGPRVKVAIGYTFK